MVFCQREYVISGPLQNCPLFSKVAWVCSSLKKCFILGVIADLFLSCVTLNCLGAVYPRLLQKLCTRRVDQNYMSGVKQGLETLARVNNKRYVTKLLDCNTLSYRDNSAGTLLCPPMKDLTVCFNMTWFW